MYYSKISPHLHSDILVLSFDGLKLVEGDYGVCFCLAHAPCHMTRFIIQTITRGWCKTSAAIYSQDNLFFFLVEFAVEGLNQG